MTAPVRIRTVPTMGPDLLTALARLPETYGVALRMRIAGASEAEVATALDLDAAAVEPLLAVAEAKLRAVLLAPDTPPEDAGPEDARPDDAGPENAPDARPDDA